MRLKLPRDLEMDRYQVLEEWGAGGFGVTCLVEELGAGRRLVVKKVECVDEQEGDLAMEEVKLLLGQHHPNICGYPEAFMSWDSKISSLFCCWVMDYCDLGNLADFVQEKRKQNLVIDEKMVQNFLGQTVSALLYIHKKNIIHRNIKPSNILLKTGDVFVLSDFLPEALATDGVKITVRMDTEHRIFLSPESLLGSFSDKSDVWSLGCCVLYLATSSLCTEAEVTAALQNITLDPSHLQRSLQIIQEKVTYSEDLCTLLSHILQVNPAERPTASDLVQDPCVKKSLTVIGSPLSGLKKTLPSHTVDALKDGGVEEALEFMKNYVDYEDAQLSALRHLIGYTRERSLWTEDVIHLVSRAMVTHRDSLAVQQEASRFLQHLLSQGLERGEEIGCLTSEDLVIALVGSIRSFPENLDLTSAILHVFTMLAVSQESAEMLGRDGFLSDLLRLLEGSLENRGISMSCCDLLSCLSMIESEMNKESLSRCAMVISTLMERHQSDGEMLESAYTALWTLSLKGHVTEEHVEGIILLLLESLQSHLERPILSKNVCLVLTSLVLNSELAAYRLLVPVSGKSALSLIKRLYRVHADDPDIVENIALLISEMAQYGSLHSELQAQKVDDLMREIRGRYESIEEIIALTDSTLSRLRH